MTLVLAICGLVAALVASIECIRASRRASRARRELQELRRSVDKAFDAQWEGCHRVIRTELLRALMLRRGRPSERVAHERTEQVRNAILLRYGGTVRTREEIARRIHEFAVVSYDDVLADFGGLSLLGEAIFDGWAVGRDDVA